MNCQEVTQLMQRELDLDLAVWETEAMHLHIETCAECSAMYQRLTQLNEDLVNLPKVAPPFSIVDSILPQLERLEILSSEQHVTHMGSQNTESRRGTFARWRERLNYKMIGGAVAAGILFSVFITQIAPGTHRDINENEVTAADTGMMKQDQYGTDAQSLSMNSMESAEAEDQVQTKALVPERSDSSAGDNTTSIQFSGDESQMGIAASPDAAVQDTDKSKSGINESATDTKNAPVGETEQPGFGIASVEENWVVSGAWVPSPDSKWNIEIRTKTDENVWQLAIIGVDGAEHYASDWIPAELLDQVQWSEDGKLIMYEKVDGEKRDAETIDVTNIVTTPSQPNQP